MGNAVLRRAGEAEQGARGFPQRHVFARQHDISRHCRTAALRGRDRVARRAQAPEKPGRQPPVLRAGRHQRHGLCDQSDVQQGSGQALRLLRGEHRASQLRAQPAPRAGFPAAPAAPARGDGELIPADAGELAHLRNDRTHHRDRSSRVQLSRPHFPAAAGGAACQRPAGTGRHRPAWRSARAI